MRIERSGGGLSKGGKATLAMIGLDLDGFMDGLDRSRATIP
jgi:hypothetical protein